MSKPVFSDLFRLSGRRNRKSYLAVLILVFAVFFLLSAFAIPPVTDPMEIAHALDLSLLAVCYVVGLMAASQRFRDLGWSGWWGLSILLPILGWLVLIALLFIPGSQGSNKYGPNSLAPDVSAS